MTRGQQWVLVGGSGWMGSALASHLSARGDDVTVVDRNPPPVGTGAVTWLAADLLTDVDALPAGRVVVLTGTSEPVPAARWTLALDNAFTAARLAPALRGRDVVMVSSVEVYGWAEGPLTETTPPALPLGRVAVADWCARVLDTAREGPCPPWRVARLCRALAEADPGGRWVYALSKLAQEQLVTAAAPAALSVFRVANVFGPGQDRAIARLARRACAGLPLTVTGNTVRSFVTLADVVDALATPISPGTYNLGGHAIKLLDLATLVRDAAGSTSSITETDPPAADSCGDVDSGAYTAARGPFEPLDGAVRAFVEHLHTDNGTLFAPALPVVIPARPARPDVVAERQADAQWTGRLKHGARWSTELRDRLAARLGLDRHTDRGVVVTTSGTAALRLAIAAVAGPAADGESALLPSYTFPATAEVLAQLGYRLRFVDVDRQTWNIDPHHLDAALARRPARVVVAVDTFGNPADYARLRSVCDRHGAVLIGDSAAAFGSTVAGAPVGTQADAHAFSASFAKVVSAGGAGGFACIPAGTTFAPPFTWDRSEGMSELHAIAALDQLEALDEHVEQRRALAATYRRAFDELAATRDARLVHLQTVPRGNTSTWTHLVARVPATHRTQVAATLAELGVETKYYFPALHHTGYGAARDHPLPATELLHREAFALPMSSELTPRHVERVMVGLERALAVCAGDRRPTALDLRGGDHDDEDAIAV